MTDQRALTSAWAAERDGFTALPIRIVSPPKWRPHEDGGIEIYRPSDDDWKRMGKKHVPILEAVLEGRHPGEIVRIVRDHHPEATKAQAHALVKKTYSRLFHWGILEVEVPQVPERFAGRYEVVKELGRGGMGIVWLARDLERGGTEVAIKHAWSWKGGFAKREELIREEADVLRALDHPRIVRYLDAFEVDGRLHLVREYIDGTKLSQRARDGPIAPHHRLHYLQVIGETLDHLMDRGYMLLDVKPGNYFVSRDDRELKLGDLGQCEPIQDGVRRVKGAMATRMYNPPEVWKDRTITEETFVFVLGVSACQLVTSKPMKSDGNVDAFERRLHLVRKAMREHGATELELAFFDACCAPRPEDRPSTVLDALALLEGQEA